MKTYGEINERIESGKAVVLTAEEIIDYVDRRGLDNAAREVDVVTTAKRSLEQGNLIDGIGGFDTYGQCERYDVTRREGLLPIGLAEGARLVRDVPRDEVVRLSDVELPPDRLCDVLRKEQDVLFPIDEGDLPGGTHGMDSRV